MDLTENAINKILSLATIEEMEIDGRKYTTGVMHPVFEPIPAPLTVNTLTGFVDYTEKCGEDFLQAVVQVVNHSKVSLVSKLLGKFEQRKEYVVATTDMYPNAFTYGSYYSTEKFLIALQTHFEEGWDRANILKLVGNIRDEKVNTVADDGISQQVTAKVGVAYVETADVPNPVTLAPYRTFREVEQPASKFVFRMKPGAEGELPTCALFEADGSVWKISAVKLIRDFLSEKVSKDIPILA